MTWIAVFLQQNANRTVASLFFNPICRFPLVVPERFILGYVTLIHGLSVLQIHENPRYIAPMRYFLPLFFYTKRVKFCQYHAKLSILSFCYSDLHCSFQV